MPSTSLELEVLLRNYLLNRLDNLYLNPLVGRVGVSMRKLASKYGISRKTLAKNGVTYRKHQPCPRYSPGQPERARAAADDLRRNFFSSSIIPFVQKSNNSPNSFKIRQIEKFWAILKERATGRHQVSECWNKESTKSWWSWSLLSAKPCLEDSSLRSEKQQISAYYQ